MAKKKPSTSTPGQVVPPDVSPRWLVLKYEPVSLFSLRSTYSMSKGGKTLLLPTPYAVKMALIDASFREADSNTHDQPAREIFDQIKDRRIRFRPPHDCVVQNTFVKIRQDERDGDAGYYVPTIAYREFVFFAGPMEIGIDAHGWSLEQIASISRCAAHVNYFGKRGSFFQFTDSKVVEELPPNFSISDKDGISSIAMDTYGVTQFLDDFGPELCAAKDGFERISTFHGKDIKIGKHRVLVSTLLPYLRMEATRSFTHYVSRPNHES